MIFVTAVENFILFSSLIAACCFTLVWILHHLTLCGLWHVEPYPLTRFYTISLISPPLLSAWLVAASILPEWWLGEKGFEAAHSTPLHQLHLLGELTSALEPGLAYATLLFAAAASAFAVYTSLRGYIRVSQLVGRLGIRAVLPAPEQVAVVERVSARHGIDVGLVMSDCPLSFVWGFWRSKLVISSGLLQTLTAKQLCGVIEHEAAHHLRRDNLMKLVLAVASYLSLLFPLSRLILRWRAEQVELVCDEVAAGETANPLEIAQALVTLRRCLLPLTLSSPVAWSGFIPDDAPSLERRVRRLIAYSDLLPLPERTRALSQTPRGEAVAVALIFGVTLFIVSVFAPLAVHHATEYIIRII